MRLLEKARFEMIARWRMSKDNLAKCCVALFAFLILQGTAQAQPNTEDVLSDTSNSSLLAVDPNAVEPLKELTTQPADSQAQGVRWKSLFSQSLRFTLFEHAFRYATEPATR